MHLIRKLLLYRIRLRLQLSDVLVDLGAETHQLVQTVLGFDLELFWQRRVQLLNGHDSLVALAHDVVAALRVLGLHHRYSF